MTLATHPEPGGRPTSSSVPSPMPDPAIERLPQLYSRPGFLLRRAHQIYVAIFEENFARLGISPAQYSVMIALHDLQGINQGELAKAIGMNKVTVSQIVQALETRGWVSRKQSDPDRRRLRLTLTPAGKKALNQTAEMAEATYAEQMAPLSAAERQRLMKLLQRIVTDLEPRARTPFEPVTAQG
ncbi:MarR family winged helix-turn-helix transcriptional regulator [Bordetella genomosp. 12]|uniref:HTH marR-type domain-containing protein n=1 Tax=Bordetella genomosp. 12 TaxID=463035 RepID=A0A261VCB6_9BORD|nr:MarR family transcriptional regulator [Bordetella genomosp. 12]OZI71788.1 hypothetical protein CAL22_18510 [Bordetella genomosp. 12]